ncbi:oxidoreductase [Synechococcus sp. CS-1325]|uniref:NADH-quinone oxidoreductase subunit B family protein n=1 Tax=Synechococcus sp. CS-1325 TaxID=2847979 RepID=UPI000DAF4D40|nr:oxidoreductase [Synechococcus sp. CS-1325]MCT0198341.1 oxidoreductase [Synechococcus sp. CS-1325]PZV00200.1 MAG: oxidoreductase [Cyanobium sp.]
MSAPESSTAGKLRLATVWLTGCSGCHMSFLDLDEWLIELADQVDVVFSPIASDVKTYPEHVDVALVEGGVGTSDNLALIRQVRQRTRLLVAFGDCAITANVPGMRNRLQGPEPVLRRAYLELADGSAQLPLAPGIVPELLEGVIPVHELVPVDLFLPGCPPPAARIRAVLEALLRGEAPLMEGAEMIRFG